LRKFCFALIKISGLLFFLIVWQVVSSLKLFEPTLLPQPIKVFSSFITLFTDNNLFKEIIYTLQRVFFGFFFASILGVFIGLIIGVNSILYCAFEWLIDFFRSIPVVTLYPIFILLFGISDDAKIAMTFWATFWIITLNTAYGVRQTSKMRIEVAKVYGANSIQSFRLVTFYEALPHILVGMRIAISCSLLAEIMCEMFMGSDFGIGQKIYEFNVRLSAPELYALIAITGVLGIVINRFFVLLEKKMIPWVGKT